MTIVNLGVSHRIATAEVLEKLAVPSIDEVTVLSTCNRVEVYAAARSPAGPVARAVADVLAAHGQVEASQRYAATSTPGCASSPTARSTPSCWRWRDCPGSASSTVPPRLLTPRC